MYSLASESEAPRPPLGAPILQLFCVDVDPAAKLWLRYCSL